MGRVKSKTKQKDTKKRNIVIAVFVAVVFAVFLLMALNPHPKFDQLAKDYDKGIPVDWQAIEQDNYKDFYGNCIFTLDPVECPYIKSIFITENSSNDKFVYRDLVKFLVKNGFTNEIINQKCGDVSNVEDIQSNDCTISVDNGDTVLLFSLAKRGVGSQIKVVVIAYEKN